MRELSLFSGAGGGILGSMLLGHTIVGAVEINEYCCKVLEQRQRDGTLERFPIFQTDIRDFIRHGYAELYKGRCDIVSGGFPCQAHSSASRGRRTARDWWPEMRQVVEITCPPFVFAENVSAAAIDCACTDLRRMGYATRKVALSAADLGADHIRQRYWLLAYTDSYSELRGTVNAEVGVMPEFYARVWGTYPDESGMANGMAHRMDRLRAIGNGQIPTVVATAWQLLTT